MGKRNIDQVISTLYLRYKCINEEDFYVEKTDKYIVINWHTFMDGRVNLLRVRQVAKYLRKYTSLQIYDALCNTY